MVNIPDDWEKPRTRQQHLTQEEIQTLRSAFNCGLGAREAARSVSCSTRIAYKYFSIFRNGILPRREKTKQVKTPNIFARRICAELPAKKAHDRESRFYKGNFEL